LIYGKEGVFKVKEKLFVILSVAILSLLLGGIAFGQAGNGTVQPSPTGGVIQNEQDIAQLRVQGVGETTVRLANRANANFIISLTTLLVGIIAVALATLGL